MAPPAPAEEEAAAMAPPAPAEEEAPVLLRSHLSCSICLDLFQDPVTTRCGHTFCQRCLRSSLLYSDQACPLCKAYLAPADMKVSVLLRALLEDWSSAQARGPEEGVAGGVACDMCVGRKRKAVKSCLVCLTSFCQPHLEPHLSAGRLKGHTLVRPVRDLEQRACLTHGRPLELYCRDAQRCVCALCVDGSRHLVPAETEWVRKKAGLENFIDEMKRRVEVRKRKVEEIRQAEELSTGSIDRQKGELEEAFREVMARVQEVEAQLLQPLMEKRKEVQREAQQVAQEMEEEISELQQRISDLGKSADHEDHIFCLQSYPALPGPEERDWASVALVTDLRLGSVREVLSVMMEQINQELEPLSSTDIERIQKFSVDVTFDPDTANPRLVLSEDRKEVWDGGQDQDVPDGPERFDLFGSVLGRPFLGCGRGYWQVQVGGKTGWDLGVAQESVNRKGKVSLTPENGVWCLVLYDQDNYAALTSPPLRLPLREQPRTVGVYVDYEGGQVSFYSVEARTHIYSFTGCSFTEKLYPYFSPHFCSNGKNSAPLVISPVSQT